MSETFLTPTIKPEDDDIERSLRPRDLGEFVGQERIKEPLDIALQAARGREEALDHVLLVGPPGLGKTSLAFIVRAELGTGIRCIAGPALERKGDMAAILTSLETRDVLFICGGAFDGLDKIIENRTGRRQIGFTKDEVASGVPQQAKHNPYAEVEPDDLLRFGLIPELVGRLPVVVSLETLDEASLVRILVEPKNALSKQYKKLFELEDVRLTFEQEALLAVAQKALKHGTGARGLRAILEDVMRDIMYDLPGRDDVTEVVVTRECILEGRPPLLVTEPQRAKKEA